MRILFLFIDGFGIGPDDSKVNPIVAADTPTFDWLFKGGDSIVIPTDASQGVKGIPQSATGQTALLTGVQASQIIGRHVNGFPGPTLRKIIAEKNILKQMKAREKKATFANAYTEDYVKGIHAGKIKGSVTTVSVLTSNLPFRLTDQIPKGKAVYQDFTNRLLIKQGLNLPLMKPEEAGQNLARIVKEHDFTLYEYFLTDIAGHRQDMEFAVSLLEELDRFIGQVLSDLDLTETLVVLSSDHGNIEDLSIKTHTCNPVPTILIGCGKDKIGNKIKELVDITPALLSLMD
ncbi:hypothetical protein BBF96_06095 [Anoxybacter fermentans]|uniref:Metalloenzyme domain-containing protein n=1 Tax=Anoxybacter fermentans TaxID=1323375 RepID=A0A3S9SXE2_9FIRM|nr:alkaline phosphatase family protein [Anoxybacter fermentans]AZR73003.1 hypothetical protein BBF96_06095 [Anoxybacter fermentans]